MVGFDDRHKPDALYSITHSQNADALSISKEGLFGFPCLSSVISISYLLIITPKYTGGKSRARYERRFYPTSEFTLIPYPSFPRTQSQSLYTPTMPSLTSAVSNRILRSGFFPISWPRTARNPPVSAIWLR